MLKDNLIKLFENYTSRNEDYLGIMFYSIYHEPATHYRLYLDENCKLKCAMGYDYFGNISKNIQNHIDTRFLLDSFKQNPSNNYTICCSEYTYMIVGKSFPFFIEIFLNGESEVADSHIDLYCKDNCIDNVLSTIKPYFKKSKKREKIDFGVATFNGSSIYTSYYDYEPKNIDIDLNYNDDFKIPYEKMCEVIEQEDKTGLILLYGEPGTGKSSVIKNLITKFNETEFVFVDGSLLSNASQNSLISYFIENQNTVFILEDCEKVLLSREEGFNPIINTLLNITDGIIGDVLGIKLICTFNTSLSKIDKALLRKGRLSLKYEFKKLKADKASKILGKEIKEDMTLADIYNYDEENDYSKKSKTKIGF